MDRCVNALKEWTGKESAAIVFDSTVDEFTNHGLFNKVKKKRNVALVATTTDGDVFGAFYSVAVAKLKEDFDDPNIFAFSFESRGRCETPQRFVVKEECRDNAGVKFYKGELGGWGVEFYGGCGWFLLGFEKSDITCWNLSLGFAGIEDTTLTGKNWESFTCCRLVAVHLE